MISDGTYLTTSPPSPLPYTQELAPAIHFLSFPPFVVIPELYSHLRVFKLAVSSAWNISYWLCLINQVSAQKPFPDTTCQIMVIYKKIYTLLSTSICLTHSLLCIYSIACTPLCGVPYIFCFLPQRNVSSIFYLIQYCFPRLQKSIWNMRVCVYVCVCVSHSIVSDSLRPCGL